MPTCSQGHAPRAWRRGACRFGLQWRFGGTVSPEIMAAAAPGAIFRLRIVKRKSSRGLLRVSQGAGRMRAATASRNMRCQRRADEYGGRTSRRIGAPSPRRISRGQAFLVFKGVGDGVEVGGRHADLATLIAPRRDGGLDLGENGPPRFRNRRSDTDGIWFISGSFLRGNRWKSAHIRRPTWRK